MRTTRLLLCTGLLVLISVLCADFVTIDNAHSAAEYQINKYSRFANELEDFDDNTESIYEVKSVTPLTDDDFVVIAYVAELNPHGYVVISVETNIEPIIAFSFKNNFVFEQSNRNILLSLVKQDMKNRIAALNLVDHSIIIENNEKWENILQNSQASSSEIIMSDMEVFGPLLITHWDQGAPYNTYCPVDPETGSRCVTGCVATALAMNLHYYEYPPSVSFDEYDSYISKRDGRDIYLDAPPASMDTINYRGAGTEPDSLELARLMLACGISVKMSYSSDGSGAWLWNNHYMNKWQYGFVEDIKGEDDDFNERLAESIMNSKPATMAIWSSSDGHEINVDGFNTESGQFHLNFGWSGSTDGWYSLPDGMPAGFNVVNSANINFELPRYQSFRVPDDFTTIQEAIDSAWSYDTIIVADGRYTGEGNRDLNFKGKAIYLKSENGPYECVIDAAASSDDRHRVIEVNKGEGPNCIIEGFTITGGVTWTGSALFIENSRPIIRNCIVRNNTSWSYGGGAFVKRAQPTFENTIIRDNWGYRGGGVWAEYAKTGLVNCTIVNNSGRFAGGIFALRETKVALLNTILWNNDAEHTSDELFVQFYEEQQCTIQIEASNIDNDEIYIEHDAGILHLGEGILNLDPMFSDTLQNLSYDSYCHQSASEFNSLGIGYNLPEKDILDNERISASESDLGAYEYNFPPENRAPHFWFIPDNEIIKDGIIYSSVFHAIDLEDDEITYSLDGPDGAYINDDSLIIWDTEGLGDGTRFFTLTACDAEYCDTAIFTVEIVNGYCGAISGEWNFDDSPININCDVWIPAGETLLINPGVEVLFNGHFSLEIGQDAVLKALGTETHPILFTCLDSILTDSTGGHHGLRFLNASEACSLEYCTIENGNANSYLPYISGGGMYVQNTDVHMYNVTFRKNYAEYFGGGLYIKNSSPNIQYCNFMENHSLDDGGGLKSESCEMTFSHNIIWGNVTGDAGGGMICTGTASAIDSNMFLENYAYNNGGGFYNSSQSVVTNNEFFSNIADRYDGGGLYHNGNHNASIEHNIVMDNSCGSNGAGIFINSSRAFFKFNNIIGNSADNAGGGISTHRGSPTLEGNYVRHNSAIYGGGIRISNRSNVTLGYNVVDNNIANMGGGIYIIDNSKPQIINNTITNNEVTYGGGGIYLSDSCRVVIFNSIIHDNIFEGMEWASEIYVESRECSVLVAYSNIEEDECYSSGTMEFDIGNVTGSPAFEDTLGHIGMFSPCIDAGSIDFVSSLWDFVLLAASLYDIDGRGRPGGFGWDIGADESSYDKIQENLIIPDENEIISSYPNPFNSRTNVKLSGFSEGFYKVRISDLKGIILFEREQFISSNNEFEFNYSPSDLPSGIYTISVTDGDIEASSKLIYLK